MATKTVSREEVARRTYADYLAKADDNATLAARYDEKLAELGVNPESVSSLAVSVKSLQNARTGTQGSALIRRNQGDGN